MDTTPVTARSLSRTYYVDGDNLERSYKYYLSGYSTWIQKDHAGDWVLVPENIGEHLCIDETSLQDDLFTILSNKAGHGRQGTVISMVRGTKANEVIKVLMQIPEEDRLKVKEVTLDMSESMRSIVEQAFPNAIITLDCFHIIKRCLEAVEELRLRYKREAQKKIKKLERQFKARLKRNAYQRKWRRKKHPKNYPGKRRGPKPLRLNAKFHPPVLDNGDTHLELLSRSKYALTQTYDKWSARMKERMKLLFALYPKLKEAYDLVHKLRSIFRSKKLTRDAAKVKLHEWYQTITDCTLREVKAARDAIKDREEYVLNYFINRATNAAAESLNSKLKGFRAQVRGVSDLPFFMYRVCQIFG